LAELLKNFIIQYMADERKTFKDCFPLSQESQNLTQNPFRELEATSRLWLKEGEQLTDISAEVCSAKYKQEEILEF
jgi:hypothetical protein